MRLNSEVLKKVRYLVGSTQIAVQLPDIPSMVPFNDRIIGFLNDVSRELLRKRESRIYSDVMTFGFWIRRSSVLNLKKRFEEKDSNFHLGKGVVFHIAPSNVPVNFAYSLVSGLLTGNANMVKVPSKHFPQVEIIIEVFNKILDEYEEIKPYILCVRYDRDKDINDLFSSIADIRVVWGGDQTIAEIRKSLLPPRSEEITFADRYSLAVIDSDSYLNIEDKNKIAEYFYNDTFFSDQNACTSPRMVVWTGSRIEEAKKIFWSKEHELVEKKYTFQDIMSVNKLTSAYLIAAVEPGVKVEVRNDNLIVRIKVPEITKELMDYKDNSGYFYEYNCEDIINLTPLCNDKRCQTIAYIGDKSILLPLIKSGMKGIDRVVPMGKTMDYDLIWDGYQLSSYLTRTIVME